MNDNDYMKDAQGRMVPRHMVRELDLMEDELVRALYDRAEHLNQQLAAFRAECFEEVARLREKVATRYETTMGGRKGNVTLSSYDGSKRLTVAINDMLEFGPELQVAKKLVDECLQTWTKGGNDNVRVIVTDAFDVGKEGKIQVDKILSLRRLEIRDETWAKAMEAISNAVRVRSTKEYIRFHHRNAPDQPYTQLQLDIARV